MADEPKQKPQPQSAPEKPKPVPPVEIDPQLGDYAEKMEDIPERKK